MTFRALFSLVLGLTAIEAAAQVPAEVSPLYVITYVEVKPSARDEGAALMRQYRDASRSSAGNLRAVAVQRVRRPGQFVLVSAWQNKAAWDGAMQHIGGPREKLAAIRNAPLDDRFNNALSVGPMDVPVAAGATYGVTHVDVIPPQKDNALAALKVLGDANRAAPGNLRFEIVQQTNRPNHFTVFEMWRSREAFEGNSQSAHQREFRDKLSPMAGALYDERLYEILE